MFLMNSLFDTRLGNLSHTSRLSLSHIFTGPLSPTLSHVVGEYMWGRYDMVVLPPSFPYGGMENPMLTFLTPTLLANDRYHARPRPLDKRTMNVLNQEMQADFD